MKKEFYVKNRERLLSKMDNDSITIIHSGYNQFRSADSVHPFVINKNFYYLTGIVQVDVTLLLGKIGDRNIEWLFIDKIDEVMAKWYGRTLTKEEAAELSGIDVACIFNNEDFDSISRSLYQPTRHFEYACGTVYLDLETRNIPLYTSFGLKYAHKLTKEFPSIVIKNIYSEIVKMRMIKQPEELEEIKASISTTRNAIYNVMNHHQELDNESLAAAYHDFVLIHEDKPHSFENIIASGINATTLHYDSNNSPINKDSLLLMDVGCYTNWYSSDISRTFPVSGKFTKQQRDIYEIVLNTNKKCIEFAKDGISWLEINNYAKKLLADGLMKLGIIKTEEELINYYFHSIGHSLGLDTHDPSIQALGLMEGMVITIEPGLYIPELSIGIRIEDNIVITKNKAIVLSKDIIKDIDDIEKMMK